MARTASAARVQRLLAGVAAFFALLAAGPLRWPWAPYAQSDVAFFTRNAPRLRGTQARNYVTAHAAKKASVAASGGLPKERSAKFIRCIEQYDPNGPHDFNEGPPATGFRNMIESIRPYHPNPEWMIFPEAGFERDQKMCSMYTLATGLYKELNRAIREDNEDGMRRHAAFIHSLREVLRFKVDTICTPKGRKCKPFIGNVSRGLTLPVNEVEAIANLYEVGTEFAWPAFTSCQLDEGGLWPFDGNLNFEIECAIDPKAMDVEEVYAPVRISRFMQGSNEVLLPPMTRFRVIGEREVQTVKENEETKDVHTKILEVIDYPTPWHIEETRKH